MDFGSWIFRKLFRMMILKVRDYFLWFSCYYYSMDFFSIFFNDSLTIKIVFNLKFNKSFFLMVVVCLCLQIQVIIIISTMPYV
jgi:hypothetical protein